MKIVSGVKTRLAVTLLIFSLNVFSQSNNKFVVILDAGHGGKDPGNSYHGFVEKEIALKTTLKVERYLEKDPQIKVVYTRKKDVFIGLSERPKTGNDINANLFVSIHCNSVKNPVPYGTETYVMGLARSSTNFEIAKRENSVILLEKDYKETYKGFDPNKPETLIGLKMLQEEYLERSIRLASKIENNFSNKLHRKSRGIKQIPLWVLDASYMPSVLIELGFLSNKEEGLYLNSEFGQEKMAEAIADAIISYKKEYFGTASNIPVAKNGQANKIKDTFTSKKEEKEEATVKKRIAQKEEINAANSEVVFKVQIASGKRMLELKPANFKGLTNVSLLNEDNGFYKYVYGSTSDYKEAKQNLEVAKSKGFSSAYLIAFKNGLKISVQEAIKL
ncbi:N-acetylmuramoyl-L-alanine amidase family protein [Flavobacterium sp. W1B]|uniref:N-acetylmuramoyl-L-alanine amidase family protein n=1 Tax=Flavobacterium sp. W1B TaxID=3394146 RepID=UPI0039BC35F3